MFSQTSDQGSFQNPNVYCFADKQLCIWRNVCKVCHIMIVFHVSFIHFFLFFRLWKDGNCLCLQFKLALHTFWVFVYLLSRQSSRHLFLSLFCCMSVRGHLSRLSGAIRSSRENCLVISSDFNLCWIEYDSAPGRTHYWIDSSIPVGAKPPPFTLHYMHFDSTKLNYFESGHISSTQCFHTTSASSFIIGHYFGGPPLHS